MRAACRGFLLFELMIVVSILCFIVVLFRSTLQKSGPRMVETTLDHLYVECLVAKQQALMTGVEQKVVFDSVHNTYTIDNQIHTLPDGVIFDVLPHVQGPPATPRALLTSPCSFSKATLVCSPDGTLSAGTVYITDAQKTVLYALTSGVGAVSFLRKYRYAKGWQQR